MCIRDRYNTSEWEKTYDCTPGFSNDIEGLEAMEVKNTDRSTGLIINEFMAKNHVTIQDSDGDFSDWLEIKNISENDINLYNYSLSDDVTKPYKWQFPSITIKKG